jgi:hypothetical protein
VQKTVKKMAKKATKSRKCQCTGITAKQIVEMAEKLASEKPCKRQWKRVTARQVVDAFKQQHGKRRAESRVPSEATVKRALAGRKFKRCRARWMTPNEPITPTQMRSLAMQSRYF